MTKIFDRKIYEEETTETLNQFLEDYVGIQQVRGSSPWLSRRIEAIREILNEREEEKAKEIKPLFPDRVFP